MATTCYNNLINNKQSARRRKENIMKKELSLLPSLTVGETKDYHIVINNKGEYEIINVFGAVVMNLGKKVK